MMLNARREKLTRENTRGVVQVRLTAADKERVEAAAASEHRTLSSWLRALILDALDAEEQALARIRRPKC